VAAAIVSWYTFSLRTIFTFKAGITDSPEKTTIYLRLLIVSQRFVFIYSEYISIT